MLSKCYLMHVIKKAKESISIICLSYLLDAHYDKIILCNLNRLMLIRF